MLPEGSASNGPTVTTWAAPPSTACSTWPKRSVPAPQQPGCRLRLTSRQFQPPRPEPSNVVPVASSASSCRQGALHPGAHSRSPRPAPTLLASRRAKGDEACSGDLRLDGAAPERPIAPPATLSNPTAPTAPWWMGGASSPRLEREKTSALQSNCPVGGPPVGLGRRCSVESSGFPRFTCGRGDKGLRRASATRRAAAPSLQPRRDENDKRDSACQSFCPLPPRRSARRLLATDMQPAEHDLQPSCTPSVNFLLSSCK